MHSYAKYLMQSYHFKTTLDEVIGNHALQTQLWIVSLQGTSSNSDIALYISIIAVGFILVIIIGAFYYRYVFAAYAMSLAFVLVKENQLRCWDIIKILPVYLLGNLQKGYNEEFASQH